MADNKVAEREQKNDLNVTNRIHICGKVYFPPLKYVDDFANNKNYMKKVYRILQDNILLKERITKLSYNDKNCLLKEIILSILDQKKFSLQRANRQQRLKENRYILKGLINPQKYEEKETYYGGDFESDNYGFDSEPGSESGYESEYSGKMSTKIQGKRSGFQWVDKRGGAHRVKWGYIPTYKRMIIWRGIILNLIGSGADIRIIFNYHLYNNDLSPQGKAFFLGNIRPTLLYWIFKRFNKTNIKNAIKQMKTQPKYKVIVKSSIKCDNIIDELVELSHSKYRIVKNLFKIYNNLDHSIKNLLFYEFVEPNDGLRKLDLEVFKFLLHINPNIGYILKHDDCVKTMITIITVGTQNEDQQDPYIISEIKRMITRTFENYKNKFKPKLLKIYNEYKEQIRQQVFVTINDVANMDENVADVISDYVL